jgi:hypothetical protein
MKKTFAFMSLAVASAAYAGPIYSNQSSDASIAKLNAKGVSNSGVAAAAGQAWSEVQNDAGNTTESNTSAGNSCPFLGTIAAPTGFRLADNFAVGAGSPWIVNSIKVYAYGTGAVLTSGVWATPGTNNNMKIWNGPPNAAGSTIVWDSGIVSPTMNAMINTSAGPKEIFRVFNTAVPSPGTAPGTTRHIVEFDFAVPLVSLPAGPDYWIDYQLERLSAAVSATVFAPAATFDMSRGLASGANGMQRSESTGIWAQIIDAGNPATAPDVNQECPFIIGGAITQTTISGVVDLNGYVGTAPGSASLNLQFSILDATTNAVLQGPTNVVVAPSGGTAAYTLNVNSGISGAVKVVGDGATWLKKTINTSVGATNANINLLNGNAVDDTVIDLSDYTVVAVAFNGLFGSAPYDAAADVNKDGAVDLTDYTIVVTNFNAVDN